VSCRSLSPLPRPFPLVHHLLDRFIEQPILCALLNVGERELDLIRQAGFLEYERCGLDVVDRFVEEADSLAFVLPEECHDCRHGFVERDICADIVVIRLEDCDPVGHCCTPAAFRYGWRSFLKMAFFPYIFRSVYALLTYSTRHSSVGCSPT